MGNGGSVGVGRASSTTILVTSAICGVAKDADEDSVGVTTKVSLSRMSFVPGFVSARNVHEDRNNKKQQKYPKECLGL